jgi:hypothetical protein
MRLHLKLSLSYFKESETLTDNLAGGTIAPLFNKSVDKFLQLIGQGYIHSTEG